MYLALTNGSRLALVTVLMLSCSPALNAAEPAASPHGLSADEALLAPTPTQSRGAVAPVSGVKRDDQIAATAMLDLAAAGKFALLLAEAERSIARNPRHADAHFYLGVTREKSGNKIGAEDAYRHALAIDSTLEPAVVNLSALCIESARFQDALTTIGELAKVSGANAAVLENYAYALQGVRSPSAPAAFAAALLKSPASASLRIGYAQALATTGDKPAARRELLAVRDTVKGDVAVLASVGFELKNLGAFAECIEVLGRALSVRKAAELLTYRALCKLGAADKAGAVTDLRDAVAVEPNYAAAHFYLGGRLAEEGKLADAQAAYEAYVRLAPTGELSAKARERAELLKNKRAQAAAAGRR